MLEKKRIEKTINKTRLGGLPAPTRAAADFHLGNGKACDGCGDIITTRETLYRVDLRGIVQLRFHHECYTAWNSYKRGTAGKSDSSSVYGEH
jgi:hypothetical protein